MKEAGIGMADPDRLSHSRRKTEGEGAVECRRFCLGQECLKC